MTVNYDELSKQVLDLDTQVRFAGVANSKGEMIAGGHKENVEKILDGDNVNMSIHYALQKRDLYTNLAYKIIPFFNCFLLLWCYVWTFSMKGCRIF